MNSQKRFSEIISDSPVKVLYIVLAVIGILTIFMPWLYMPLVREVGISVNINLFLMIRAFFELIFFSNAFYIADSGIVWISGAFILIMISSVLVGTAAYVMVIDEAVKGNDAAMYRKIKFAAVYNIILVIAWALLFGVYNMIITDGSYYSIGSVFRIRLMGGAWLNLIIGVIYAVIYAYLVRGLGFDTRRMSDSFRREIQNGRRVLGNDKGYSPNTGYDNYGYGPYGNGGYSDPYGNNSPQNQGSYHNHAQHHGAQPGTMSGRGPANGYMLPDNRNRQGSAGYSSRPTGYPSRSTDHSSRPTGYPTRPSNHSTRPSGYPYGSPSGHENTQFPLHQGSSSASGYRPADKTSGTAAYGGGGQRNVRNASPAPVCARCGHHTHGQRYCPYCGTKIR